MRVALVQDWLNQMGGAEKTLLVMARVFPGAPIYTSIYAPSRLDKAFRSLDIRASFMQRLPFVTRRHQQYLPFYPFAMESFDLSEYDVVVSGSSAFAKGVVTRPETLHVCYCYTPMRWAWSFEDYIQRERVGKLTRLALSPFIHWLRLWDYATAARVDAFIAISPVVAARIAKYYRRDSVIIPPPVDVKRFAVSTRRENYFLIVSRLIPYKRIDLAVRACSKLGLPLRIVGSGRDEQSLRALAGPTVQFLGRLSDEQVREQLAGCRAFIFPGEEDFGIAPVEAQACGKPVIAYAGGGALSTVVEGVTGLFFRAQTVESLEDALMRFRDEMFDPYTIRRHAEQFDTALFAERLASFVSSRYNAGQADARAPQSGVGARPM